MENKSIIVIERRALGLIVAFAAVIMTAALIVLLPNSLRQVHAAPPPGTVAAGTGSVTGSVKLIGDPPKASPINMAKEPTCATMHAKPAMTEEVVTGPGGTLANAIVYISEGVPDKDFDPPAQPATISQKGCTYEPHVMAVQANQKIQVVNSDKTSHNIHPLPTSNREWNKSQPAGTPPFEESFAREEIAIPVKCNVHPWMRAYIAVFRHPWYTVTATAGNFELKNLPAGTYTVQAWHEKYGSLREKVTIAANETKHVDFAFKPRPGAH